jgi:hypothetical protein
MQTANIYAACKFRENNSHETTEEKQHHSGLNVKILHIHGVIFNKPIAF